MFVISDPHHDTGTRYCADIRPVFLILPVLAAGTSAVTGAIQCAPE